MDDDRREILKKMFDPNKKRTPEEKAYIKLIEEYKNKFDEEFSYPWGAPINRDKFPTDEDLLKYCLKKGKPLSKLHPNWYKRSYSRKKTGINYFE